MRRRPRRSALAVIALVLAACACTDAPAGEAPTRDTARGRLLAALPDDAVERGVWVFEPAAGDEVTPGSLLAPLIGAVLADAELVVETGAPPLNLADGVEASEVPGPAVRIGTVVVAGAPGDVDVVRARLAEPPDLTPPLDALARTDTPVAWSGPVPAAAGPQGTVLLTADADNVELVVRGTTPPADWAAAIETQLAEGAPPQSPGKPWRKLLVDPEVSLDGDAVVVRARRGDLPGALLRQLIDTRAMSFLVPAGS